MHPQRPVILVFPVAAALVLLGCGGSDSTDPRRPINGGGLGGFSGRGEVSGTGASFQTGGMPQTGGSPSTDGSVNTGGVGGSPATGGVSPTGGESGGGGGQTSGGSVGTGDAGSAGSYSAGSGNDSVGGSGATGGVFETGGSPSVGGSDSVGGAGATGGAFGTGGSPSADGSVNTGGVGGNPNANPTFHVFLLLGQSNMEGYPKAQDADRVEDDRILVLGYDNCPATGRQRDQWDLAGPPLHSCWNDGLGPGDYFAKTLIEVIPEGDSIGLVPCAINGERIETFMKSGGSKYDWIIQRARLAQQEGGVIEGILFHQGESNNGDPSWPAKVNTLVEDIKTDLGLGRIPFIAGELLYSGSCAGHNTLINQLPAVVANAHVVSAEGLVVDPTDTQWNLHFDHDSQVTLGTRYAQKMIEALGW